MGTSCATSSTMAPSSIWGASTAYCISVGFPVWSMAGSARSSLRGKKSKSRSWRSTLSSSAYHLGFRWMTRMGNDQSDIGGTDVGIALVLLDGSSKWCRSGATTIELRRTTSEARTLPVSPAGASAVLPACTTFTICQRRSAGRRVHLRASYQQRELVARR